MPQAGIGPLASNGQTISARTVSSWCATRYCGKSADGIKNCPLRPEDVACRDKNSSRIIERGQSDPEKANPRAGNPAGGIMQTGRQT